MGTQSEIVVGRERHDLRRPTLEQTRRSEGVELPGGTPAPLVDDPIQGGPDARIPQRRGVGHVAPDTPDPPDTPDTPDPPDPPDKSSNPPHRASTTRTISSAVIVSGGMTTTTSPNGRSRTPRATAPAQTRR